MAINDKKVERVALIVAQELRTQLASERAKMASEPENQRTEWPVFFHPIDVAHDWFFEQHGRHAFGRLRRREREAVLERTRELLQPEVDDYKGCMQREKERWEARDAAWAAQAGAEMQAWREAAEGA